LKSAIVTREASASSHQDLQYGLDSVDGAGVREARDDEVSPISETIE
jgi:hypothetical protein